MSASPDNLVLLGLKKAWDVVDAQIAWLCGETACAEEMQRRQQEFKASALPGAGRGGPPCCPVGTHGQGVLECLAGLGPREMEPSRA